MVGSLFERRFSCRSFEPKTLSDAELEPLLEAARWAPSAGNLQPWRFVVVRSPTLREGLARSAHGQEFVAAAPVVIVVCAVPAESARRYRERGEQLYCLQDTAAAVENILLAATEHGLGSCWVGAFDEDAAARCLSLPAGWRPVAMVPVGWPAEEPRERQRRPLHEVAQGADGEES
jgi:nitroreductase